MVWSGEVWSGVLVWSGEVRCGVGCLCGVEL